jgi:hypothetical protein
MLRQALVCGSKSMSLSKIGYRSLVVQIYVFWVKGAKVRRTLPLQYLNTFEQRPRLLTLFSLSSVIQRKKILQYGIILRGIYCKNAPSGFLLFPVVIVLATAKVLGSASMTLLRSGQSFGSAYLLLISI